MNNQNQLHQLIHKLNKSEKRAFKLYAGKYATNKTQKAIKLFDLLNKMTVYDEDKLLETFTKSQLTYQSHKLKNLLMSALSYFHYTDINKSMGEIINRIELGFKYQDVTIIEEYLKKGFKIAEQNNQSAFKVHLFDYQQKLSILQKDVNKLFKTEQKYIEELSILSKRKLYDLLWTEVTFWRTKNLNKKEPEPIVFSNPQLTKLFNAPLDKNASFEEKNKFLESKRNFYEVVDRKKFEEFLEQIYQLHLNYNQTIKIGMLHLIILISFENRNIEKVEALLHKFGFLPGYQIAKLNMDMDRHPFLFLIILYMYFLYKKDFTSILAMEHEVEKLFESKNYFITIPIKGYEQTLYPFLIACFKSQEYNKCLDWISRMKLFYKQPIELRSLIYTVFQFIEFFCHLELGNTQLLPSLLHSIQYTVKIKNSIDIVEEQELIRIIKALIKQGKFNIRTQLFNQKKPFTYYQIFFPYVEHKQKELEQ